MTQINLKEHLVDKYRPKVLGELIGTKQQVMARDLAKALTNGCLLLPILLSGPPGVGKTTTAQIIALCLNCDNGPTPTPCGLCAHCRAGGPFWSIEFSAAAAKADKKFKDALYVATMGILRDKFPVIIVDDVDLITRTNAVHLQSLLQRPPPKVTFVLCTNNINKVPMPMQSRCQRYELPKIGNNKMFNFLNNIAIQEGAQVSSQHLAEIARFADGQPRDALHELEKYL